MKNFSIKKLFNLIIFALCLTLIITSFAFAQSGDPSDLIDEYPSPIFTDLTINDSLNANEALFKGKIIFENVIEVFASASFKEGVIFKKEIDVKTHILNTSVDEAGDGKPVFVKDYLLVEGDIKGLNNLIVEGEITANSINMGEMFTVTRSEQFWANSLSLDVQEIACSKGETIACSFEPCSLKNQLDLNKSIETKKIELIRYIEENFNMDIDTNVDYDLASPSGIKEFLPQSTQQTFINILNHSDIYGEPLTDEDSIIVQINGITVALAPYKHDNLTMDDGSVEVVIMGRDNSDMTNNLFSFEWINEQLGDANNDELKMNIYIYDASEEAWFEARPSPNPVFENNEISTINSLELIVLNPTLEDVMNHIQFIKNFNMESIKNTLLGKLFELLFDLNEILKDDCISLDGIALNEEANYHDYLFERIKNIESIENEILKFFGIGELALHLGELLKIAVSEQYDGIMQNYQTPHSFLKNTERGKICVGGVYNSSSFVNISYYLNASCFNPSAKKKTNAVKADVVKENEIKAEEVTETEINTAEVTEIQKIMYKMISP